MMILTAVQMKTLENKAVDLGISHYKLMENAGRGAAEYIQSIAGVENRNCIVFCGKGNNGGDGLMAARVLKAAGAKVAVALTDGKPTTQESLTQYDLTCAAGVPLVDCGVQMESVQKALEQTDIIIDAVYGTGFSGKLDDRHRLLNRFINGAAAAVFALDLPSGVFCDSGCVEEDAVVADFTIAFDSAKPCHFQNPSQQYCGTVQVVDIGIPAEAKQHMEVSNSLLDESMVFDRIKERPKQSHKGDYGRLLSLVGCRHYVGAAALSTMGALRTGVGCMVMASTEKVCNLVSSQGVNSIFLPLPPTAGGTISEHAFPMLTAEMQRCSALLVGPGLGRNAETDRLVIRLLETATIPMVIDADGINILAENIDVLRKTKCKVILTPHVGEMARLCQRPVADVLADRLHIAAEFAKEYNVILLLKGSPTTIHTPDGKVYYSTTGNPGMAKGGSGDVLAGVIASLVAQGMPELESAFCGAYLHGAAGDLAAAKYSQAAMLPEDVAHCLCEVFLRNQR